MARRVSQDEWNKRAELVSLVWLENVSRNDIAVLAKCLNCSATFSKLPSAVSKGGGCPECARKQSRVSTKKWLRFASDLHFDWVSDTPESLDDKTKEATCLKCGNNWTVSPRALYRRHGHPYCPSKKRGNAQRLSFEEWQSRAEGAGLEFLEEPSNSKSRTPARCLKCGHEWSPVPINVSSLGSGCPRCGAAKGANTRLKVGSMSAKEQKHRLQDAAKISGLVWIDLELAKLGGRAGARCLSCFYEWSPWVSNVLGKQTSCPRCAGNQKVSQEEWERRAKSVGVTLLSSVGGRHSDALGRCDTCGTASTFNVGTISFGHGCKICGQRKSSAARTLPYIEWQERARERHLVWLEPTGSNSEHRAIRCLNCAYEWKVAPTSMRGCPRCSKRLVTGEDWNRRAAAVSARWLEAPRGARQRTLLECLSCRNTWSTTPDSITHGSGCPSCAETGFNPAKDSYLYLVQDSERKCRKLGISNLDKNKTRLKAHKANGFTEVIFYFEHASGELIASLESSALAWIRVDHGLPQLLGKADMPQRGWTETFSFDGPSNAEIVDHIIFLSEKLITAYES